MINLDEQQACTVVQLPDFAENCLFCTPVIVNISIPLTLDPKKNCYTKNLLITL